MKSSTQTSGTKSAPSLPAPKIPPSHVEKGLTGGLIKR
jgi:hypothetical protein